MQKIEDYIRDEVFAKPLRNWGVLVIYDPARRYREIAESLKDGAVAFVDASESSIESREAAQAALDEMGRQGGKVKGLVIYIPKAKPVNDHERQRDPFSFYGAIGYEFPRGDGDNFRDICLRAKEDSATEVWRVFNENPNPDFAVINAIGGGKSWPTLAAALGNVESVREILLSFLTADEKQRAKLDANDAWVSEAKDLFGTALKLRLVTKSRKWEGIALELWRYLLFSEFAFDLPGELPAGLVNVPRAPIEARPLVFYICDGLRKHDDKRSVYIERATEIEKELNLADICGGIVNLGERDTFPFEERKFFSLAVEAVRVRDYDAVLRHIAVHKGQVWSHRGENMASWQLVEAAAELMRRCEDVDRELAGSVSTQSKLLDFYSSAMYEVDRAQREFEQAERDLLEKPTGVDELMGPAREAYRTLANKVQGVFLKHLESAGWPPEGRLSNTEVFDRKVAPAIRESGRRVGVLLIDALRYELGAELAKQLANSCQTDIEPAYAQLPTITPVGMAGHLPGAGGKLRLVRKDGAVGVALGEAELPTVLQRMEILKKAYGDRFFEMGLKDFLKSTKKKVVPEGADLVVLRNTDIDMQLENAPSLSLKAIHDALKAIVAAIGKLQRIGIREVYVLTDHGFYLNTALGPGDVCQKPAGDWVPVHERMLLGVGAGDAANAAFSAVKCGVKGDFETICTPMAMVPYRAGVWYFHGGASLQEAVVPVISVKGGSGAAQEAAARVSFVLSYKHGATKITTLMPMIDVIAQADFFDATCECRLEAYDRTKKLVGEAKMGGNVNPATGTIVIHPGNVLTVPMRMDSSFEGDFTVKAVDPVTGFVHAELKLKTDYNF